MAQMGTPYWDQVETRERQMQEAFTAGAVEFLFDDTGKVWLNIDGKCAVRIGTVTNIIVTAPREQWSGNFEFENGQLVGVKSRKPIEDVMVDSGMTGHPPKR